MTTSWSILRDLGSGECHNQWKIAKSIWKLCEAFDVIHCEITRSQESLCAALARIGSSSGFHLVDYAPADPDLITLAAFALVYFGDLY